MRKHYQLLLLAVLASVGACTSDTPKETARQPAKAPVAADSPATGVPDDTAAAPNATAAPPAASEASEPATAAVRQPAYHKAESVTAAPRRRLRPVPFCGTPPGEDAATDSSQAVNAAELEQFMMASLPAPQRFTIRPGRDTLLTGAQGTQLLVAASAWDVPANSGPVELRMQEFYQLADIVLAGLTTTAGSNLLETGGMVHLDATANGKPVRLKPGAAVHLRMPTAKVQQDMQLFQSSGPASGSRAGFDWQLPPALGAAATPPWSYTKPAARWQGYRRGRRRGWLFRRRHSGPAHYTARYVEVPAYDGGEARAIKSVTRNIEYSSATQARMRKALRKGRRIGKTEFVELRKASKDYGEHVIRLVHATFCVDTAGRAHHFAVLPGADEALGNTVLSAVRKLNRWEPALMPRQPRLDSLTEVQGYGQITAYFTESGKVLVDDSVRWNRQASWAFRDSVSQEQMRRANDRQRNYYASLSPRQRRALDSTARVQLVAERERIYRQFGNQETADANQAILYNELSSQSLGWINCDRFLNAGPRIQFVVNAATRNTIATLVFRNIKSTMRADVIGSRTVFQNVPTGQAATVVALRREKGITYLARHDVLLDPKGLAQLNFKPVTVDELRTELGRLN